MKPLLSILMVLLVAIGLTGQLQSCCENQQAPEQASAITSCCGPNLEVSSHKANNSSCIHAKMNSSSCHCQPLPLAVFAQEINFDDQTFVVAIISYQAIKVGLKRTDLAVSIEDRYFRFKPIDLPAYYRNGALLI